MTLERFQLLKFPWARWRRSALRAGVPEPLAELGSDLMMEAFSSSWPRHLKALGGVEDDGLEMLWLAYDQPEFAAWLWKNLLVTDGFHAGTVVKFRFRNGEK